MLNRLFFKEKSLWKSLDAKQMFGFEKIYKLLMNVNPIFASKKIWINVGNAERLFLSYMYS